MFHFLFYLPHADHIAVLRLFKYLTFRSGGAVLTALFIAFWLGPRLIPWLKVKQGMGQPIREDGPSRHIIEKKGTPTMGGLMVLIPGLVATLLWADLSNAYVWIVMFVTVAYGCLGFIDDYQKVTKHSSAGLSGNIRLLAEFGIAALATYLIIQVEDPMYKGMLAIPFLKQVLIPFGMFYIAIGAIVVAGSANAVNFTDGLDGLAIMPVIIASAAFVLIAYLVGNEKFATYLQVDYIRNTGELSVFLSALIGAGLGFLWYNAPPASVFMGDTGSLSLGGALGAVAVAVKHELVLAIVGGLFVLETVSVIVQVASFKLTGKRVFRMAPLHHHFEQKGWAEPTIVIRFWIIAVILALVGLSSLKLR